MILLLLDNLIRLPYVVMGIILGLRCRNCKMLRSLQDFGRSLKNMMLIEKGNYYCNVITSDTNKSNTTVAVICYTLEILAI